MENLIFKKLVCILLAVLIMVPPVQVGAVVGNAPYTRLTADTYAVVTQVIDGDALRVRPLGSNQEILVSLAGINTQGSREARDFMAGAVLGRTVFLTISAAGDTNARWTPVYLSIGDVAYNRALAQRGLALVDYDYQYHWMFGELLVDATRARGAGLGTWEDTGFHTQPAPRNWRRNRRPGNWDERININTASSSQINRVLYDVWSGTGSAIVRGRRYSPFRTIDDIKFVADALTREEFDDFWGALKVSTNINTANQDELIQLFGVSPSNATSIIRARERNRFTSTGQLVELGLMSPASFEENRRFMSVNDVDDLAEDHEYTDWIVNVNTANVDELQRAGFNSAQAGAIVDARVNGYTIKSIGEIQRIPAVNISERRLFEIAGNLAINDNQLTGWRWQSFNQTRVNINTANRNQLWSVGFNDQQINQIFNRRSRFNSAHDLPFNVSQFDDSITLFTNVNTATPDEWMSLHVDISSSFADTITREAANQPFGSWWELRDFFYENDYDHVYFRIRDFLVIR